MQSLHNKRIILGLSGGIAAYKAAELCRLLIKAGAEVRVVMTQGAQAFITPLTLQALSGQRVHTDLLDAQAEAAMGHIELARWADLILVAPASASFIARLAAGEGSDLLSTLCLARRGRLALAPAMNQAMWHNAASQANLHTLRQRGVDVWGPDSGMQACGDIGLGRMLEPDALARHAASCFANGLLAGLRVTLTAGPTREALDPVRYLSNHSSGKMGYALAQAAVEAGAAVTLISGPTQLAPPERLQLIAVQTATEMLQACQQHTADLFIAVAAVADYRPATSAPHKLKKDQESMTLALVRNPDILATMAASTPRPFCVGFAAETQDPLHYARGKLQAKGLDLIFANDATSTFGSDTAEAVALWRDGEQRLARAGKAQLAREMIQLIAERLRA